jgi:hypothetical protein
MKRRTTPELACIEYAIAVAEVRRLTELIGKQQCERQTAWAQRIADGYEAVEKAQLKNTPAPEFDFSERRPETCVTQHWQSTLEGSGDYVREVPVLALEDCCAGCQAVIELHAQRKMWRRKLGAAKRSIEALGKRLNRPQVAA